jgi:osmotically-inducible protein OsmY
VVLSVDGIESVTNRLQIKPPGGGTASHSMDDEVKDAQLETKVKRHLYTELGKRARQIEVEAVDGVVSLRGTLPDEARKKIALDTAGKTKDVRRVVDLIKVKP